jgi:hypothetical protein
MKKTYTLLFAICLFLSFTVSTQAQENTLMGSSVVSAQDKVTAVSVSSEAAEGLDLVAVGELFKDSKDLEAFEKALNDPAVGVNNLDLDDNGDVDFIRVVEEVKDDTHVIILQVPLAKNEFQDVATIEIEKNGKEEYNFQIRGNEEFYGVDYYVAPADVHIYRWPIVSLIYTPVYRPYRSTFYFGFYPGWYHPFHPVAAALYHTRTVRFTTRATFAITRTPRVKSVTKVHYTAHHSTLVKHKTTVTHSRGRTTVTRSTAVRNRRGRP